MLWATVMLGLATLAPGGFQLHAAAAPANEFKGTGLCRFALHDVVLSRQTEAAINGGVAQLFALRKSVFGVTNAPSVNLKLRLFRKSTDFTIYYGSHYGRQFHVWAGGAYIASDQVILTSTEGSPARFHHRVLHEATHAILDQTVLTPPLWFNEGCAEYFAGLVIQRSGMGADIPHRRLASCRTMLQQNRLPALVKILEMQSTDWPAVRQHEIYAACWSLVRFLDSDPRRRGVLREFYRRLDDQRGIVIDSKTALQEIYPGGLDQMEKDWRRWLAN